MLSVSLQQPWSLEALSWSSSWPSWTMARLSLNPWSKSLCFAAKMHFMCCVSLNSSSCSPSCSCGWTALSPPLLYCSLTGPVSLRKKALFTKKALSDIVSKPECHFSIKHQLCSFSTSTDFLFFALDHLLILPTTSISFPHSPLWLYQIAFISGQPWYSIEGRHHSAVSEPSVE